MAATGSKDVARAQFEVENNVGQDEIFFYDEQKNRATLDAQPWKSDPHHFTEVKMSAVALLKMMMHARSGKTMEVMGIMQGKVVDKTMVVMDCFALPVEGLETRVNAGNEANEYMVTYISSLKQAGRLENAIGWYHSHPSYGCWLSGIDVGTQMMYQKYYEPFLAVVIDPTRSCTAGKVEIGAFRTYPENYKPPNAAASEYQSVPLSKIEDFGAHANSYYQIPLSFFKSSSDAHLLNLLWTKYWVSTLSSNPLLSNRSYFAGAISDLSEKLEKSDEQLALSGRLGGYVLDRKKEDTQLAKATTDSSRTTIEQISGLTTQVLKNTLFNCSVEAPDGPTPMQS